MQLWLNYTGSTYIRNVLGANERTKVEDWILIIIRDRHRNLITRQYFGYTLQKFIKVSS